MIFWGACPVGRRLTLPLWCPQGRLAFLAACLPRRLHAFLPPSPRPPSPPGKGENITLFRRGLPPPAPRALNRLRHLQSLPSRYQTGVCFGVASLAQNRQEAVLYEQSRQPRRGGTGGEELRRMRWSSPPGQGEPVPPGFSPLNFPQSQGKPATKAAEKGGEPQNGILLRKKQESGIRKNYSYSSRIFSRR